MLLSQLCGTLTLALARPQILTFAYFSTEWDMDQPFHCLCKTERCLGTIQGAKHIEQGVLDGCARLPLLAPPPPARSLPLNCSLARRYFVNDHILAMKALQREQAEQ